MSGLNPDGLGINRTFGETETETVQAESVNTETTDLTGGRSTTGSDGWPILANYIIHANGDYWYVGSDVGQPDAGDRLEQAVSDMSDRFDWVYIPPRVYRANLVIDGVKSPTLFSWGRQSCMIDGEDQGHAVEIATDRAAEEGKQTAVRNIMAMTTPGAGNNFDAFHVSGDGLKIHFDSVYVNKSDRHGLYIADAINEVDGSIYTTAVAADIDGDAVYNDGDLIQLDVSAKNQSLQHGPNAGPDSIMWVHTQDTTQNTDTEGAYFSPWQAIYKNKNGNYDIAKDAALTDRVKVSGRLFMENRVNLDNNRLRKLRTVSNSTDSDFVNQEFAIDPDRGGTGTTAIIWQDSSGVSYYWDADGTL